MKKIGIADVSFIPNYNGNNFHFFLVQGAISEEKAIELQIKLGYHPSGYGFFGFDPTISQTVWKCYNNCD